MALTWLLLMLLVQDAHGFCDDFLGLWRASALVIADSLRLVGLWVWKQHCWCSRQGNVPVQKPLGKTECRLIRPGGREGSFWL